LPLRERPGEIPSLAALFAEQAARKLGRPPPSIEPAALSVLVGHAWPGNIRELRNAIEHAVVMSDGGTVRVDALPETVRGGGAKGAATGALPAAVAEVERDRIVRALEAENHNQTRAAARLGISRRALIYKMEKYGLGRSRRGSGEPP